jgi:hypothetical protein
MCAAGYNYTTKPRRCQGKIAFCKHFFKTFLKAGHTMPEGSDAMPEERWFLHITVHNKTLPLPSVPFIEKQGTTVCDSLFFWDDKHLFRHLAI